MQFCSARTILGCTFGKPQCNVFSIQMHIASMSCAAGKSPLPCDLYGRMHVLMLRTILWALKNINVISALPLACNKVTIMLKNIHVIVALPLDLIVIHVVIQSR